MSLISKTVYSKTSVDTGCQSGTYYIPTEKTGTVNNLKVFFKNGNIDNAK